jgi:hypothetical protein
MDVCISQVSVQTATSGGAARYLVETVILTVQGALLTVTASSATKRAAQDMECRYREG